MEKQIEIKASGILNQEIILTALQEYRRHVFLRGNRTRAEKVKEIIDSIKFV